MASFNRRDERRPPSLEYYSDVSLAVNYFGGILSVGDFTFELTRRISAVDPAFLIENPRWEDKSNAATRIAGNLLVIVGQRDPEVFARWPLNLPTARIVVNRE